MHSQRNVIKSAELIRAANVDGDRQAIDGRNNCIKKPVAR